jgi:general secretion pathway protein M
MSAVRQRWEALAPRERRIIALGAAVVVAVLFYLLLWEPLAQRREAWRVRVVAAESDLAWMRAVAPQVGARAATRPVTLVPDSRSLLARADASAREAGLGAALLRVEPVSARQVRVYFEQAGFDAMMRWLEALAARQGTRVVEMSAQRADGVGLVDARVTLEDPAP